ncbi:hypothetical protein CWI80_11315 [Pseudidiomarina sediminum]|uniref:peptidylprolyl isomerase n=1 Tax=Pseudidiomarina sediminum TaxID=431675 RepID=A0A432Z0W5_9GAMM|nr:FKBP-type peptidyl-prolyl cis-trans isomerase [Pseudidiomarina sediminum]RUO69799.1 hypothetical protein CWI80_11315 [Pseudidiomarina sediminum]
MEKIRFKRNCLLLLGALSVLTGCSSERTEKDYLAEIQSISRDLATCVNQQVLPGECDAVLQEQEKLNLALKAQYDSAFLHDFEPRYHAAMKLGELEAGTPETPSIYHTVTAAYAKLPVTAQAALKLQHYNYAAFAPTMCEEQAKRSYYQHFDKSYPRYRGRYPTPVMFYSIGEMTCIDRTKVEPNRLVISAEQLNALKELNSEPGDIIVASSQSEEEADNWQPIQALGRAYLERNGQREEVITTASGLQYEIIAKGDGTGRKPKANDFVKVKYDGWLVNGELFDSSRNRTKAAVFQLSSVMEGWSEGAQLMQVGDKYRLVIPSELAWGAKERQNGIVPAYSTLIFDVELLDVMDEPEE